MRRPTRVLGIALGAREAGFALVGTDYIESFRVLNLRALPGHGNRLDRFTSAVEDLLGRAPIEVVVVLESRRGKPMHPVVAEQWRHVEEVVKAKRLPRQILRPEIVKRAVVGDELRPTTRRVARVLIERYALHDAKAAEPFLVPSPRVPTDRERYWGKMFLAAAAASQAIRDSSNS